ncbi:MAG: hypothetical protein ACRDFS_02985 [Chloroflexota bacterium]
MKDRFESEIVERLRPARRSFGLWRLRGWIALGAGCGAIAAIVPLVAQHFAAWNGARTAALVLFATGILIGVAAGIVRWPSRDQTARNLDRELDLANAATTALEYRASVDVLAVRQRRDLSARLSRSSLHRPLGLGPRRDSFLASAVLSCAVLFILPGGTFLPSASPTSPLALERIHHTAGVTIPALLHQLKRGPLSSQHAHQVKSLRADLLNLQRRLRSSGTKAEALSAIATTQQRISELAQGNAGISTSQARALSRALHAKPGAAAKKSKSRSQRSPTQRQAALESAAQRLHQMSVAAKNLTGGQRRQLAEEFRQIQKAMPKTPMTKLFHRAARDLSLSKQNKLTKDLQALSRRLRRASRLQSASARLSNAEAQISAAGKGISDAPNVPIRRSKPTNSASLKSLGQASAKGSPLNSHPGSSDMSPSHESVAARRILQNERRRGQTSSTRSSAESARKGAVHPGTSKNGKIGHGQQGGRDEGGPGSGKYTVIFVPGTAGQGRHTSQINLDGQPRQMHAVSYRRVVGRYARSARTAMQRYALPGPWKQFARRYFDSIAR